MKGPRDGDGDEVVNVKRFQGRILQQTYWWIVAFEEFLYPGVDLCFCYSSTGDMRRICKWTYGALVG